MTATDLLFDALQPAALDMRFGSSGGGADVYIDLTIAAVLSPIVPQGHIAISVDNAVSRGPKLFQSSGWQIARESVETVAVPGRRLPVLQAEILGFLRHSKAFSLDHDSQWEMTHRRRSETDVGHTKAMVATASAAGPFGDLNRSRRMQFAGLFVSAEKVRGSRAGLWKVLSTTTRPDLLVPFVGGRRIATTQVSTYSGGRNIGRAPTHPWDTAKRPLPGVSDHGGGPVTPTDPCYKPPIGNAVGLLFAMLQPASLDLLFACPNKKPTLPDATVVIPVLRFYMQNSNVSVALAESGQVIPANGLKLSIDADSWCWGWSATVPASYMALLTGTSTSKVELIAAVNGTNFRLAVENIGRSRSFGKSQLSISGRGRAIWLGAPFADVVSRGNSIAMTAQQLMADALTENGVSNGWSIDWRITDWLVPAGSWQHRGTAMEACQAIAGAAGAYIQAHRTDQTLIVMPRYPIPPWSWSTATPDIQIPEDVCVVEGLQFSDKPAYNTVFVAGQVNGILGHVTRDGSAGDKPAPQVCDPLITHADAARQRGMAILGDTGEQKIITLSLPVLDETGIIQPGLLMRYTEGGNNHIGLTRAVEVSHDFPKLTQFVTVESHVL